MLSGYSSNPLSKWKMRRVVGVNVQMSRGDLFLSIPADVAEEVCTFYFAATLNVDCMCEEGGKRLFLAYTLVCSSSAIVTAGTCD
jgi:hypothetical protein